MILRQMKARLSAILLALAAVLFFGPGGALADVWFENYGYPYGKEMADGNVTLVIDAQTDSISSLSYQWQRADSKDGTYEDIGTDSKVLQLSSLSSSDSGKWYRCVVNGILESEPVMLVKANGRAKGDLIWTNYYRNRTADRRWYISNGSVAYLVNGDTFNVMGLYNKDNQNYMLQTSYSGNWTIHSCASPVSGKEDEHLPLVSFRASFNEDDDSKNVVNFEAKLNSSATAFCINADTQLGDPDLLLTYADSAALKAHLKDNNTLEKITMYGAATVPDNTNSNIAAFSIAPITPCSKFWIAKYYSSKPNNNIQTYAFNTESGDGITMDSFKEQRVAIQLEGQDSVMTMSWTDRPAGGTVRFQFGAGNLTSLGAVGCKVNYYNEKLEYLDESTEYTIQADGHPYSLKTDTDGRIPLETTAYSFFGKTLEIAKTGTTDTTKTVQVPQRPTATTPNDEDIIRTSGSVTFPAAAGQQYEYSTDNGTSWQTLPVGADGNCVISGLQPDSNVSIRTRKLATANSFVSDWKEISVSIPKTPIHPTITMEDWIFGGEPSKPVVTGNPGNGAVTIEYKLREDDVTSYRPEVPTQPGEYTVRVLIAETANYQGGQASAHFSILLGTDTLPRTGDRSRPALWLGLLALAGAGLAALLLRRRKS